MNNPILPPSLSIPTIPLPIAAQATQSSGTDSGGAFRAIFANSLAQVQNSQDMADRTVEQFLSGENQDLHQVAIAAQKAELTFEFFLQARNKVAAAYEEVMKIQL